MSYKGEKEKYTTNKHLVWELAKYRDMDRVEFITKECGDNFVLQEGSNVTNIIVPAKTQKNKITVMAHHDIYPGSAGFNDNSTGVAMLVRLVGRVKDNVELVFTDKEEFGGRGCRHYLENWARPVSAINVDVVGLDGTIFYEMYGEVKAFKIPKHVKYYAGVPFSDSHILRQYEVPNILMCTGLRGDSLISDIFEAQHGGVHDADFDLISEDMLVDVFQTLLMMVGN
ncbi:MAG: M28 family peptidase [Candidatus Tantalella remota]|nr:M28 family peptidase [Candidatus Tantalella remota]